MTATRNAGGVPAAPNGHDDSPFGIYRNALDFVMDSLSLDEETAARVILNEMGPYADDWERFGIRAAAGEIRAKRPPLRPIDWQQAWLG